MWTRLERVDYNKKLLFFRCLLSSISGNNENIVSFSRRAIEKQKPRENRLHIFNKTWYRYLCRRRRENFFIIIIIRRYYLKRFSRSFFAAAAAPRRRRKISRRNYTYTYNKMDLITFFFWWKKIRIIFGSKGLLAFIPACLPTLRWPFQ